MYIIAGLGNPGKEYSGTRHNVGFDTIDYLAQKHNVNLNKLKFNSIYGEFNINGEKVMLVKPVTYMNRSGIAIAEIAKFYKVPIENLIVIYDDIDIAPGSLRIRPHGSSGTHNGMKSIIYQLQNDMFPRVRIGIGRNPDMDLADYVLQRFNKEERLIIDNIIKLASEAVEEIILKSLDSSMQKFNIKTKNE
ncbi:PTH1 family peptidyl-tRNA hydrolase [Sedimentibacter acidaminivorans]|uniref:Peptidyl-tRNA hydrolase n=1 Tax=Sedimentibacter acidaminivorans TaxID=913099 RepID=A0ABS4GHD9_9FIRM|nr:aminoacyl-tRNA hydrolase [Sedimentibacter acidaminivorans]MBP1927115.1 PTH1 family peptidyl-tRNA hydrolase [Sedimentibacter acidaminivorans]